MDIVWFGARIIGLIQWFIGTILGMYFHPNPCKPKEYDLFNIIESLQMGGWMVFSSKTSEGLPKIVGQKYREQAMMFLLIVGFCFVVCFMISVSRARG